MTARECITGRRSIRNFENRVIEQDVLKSIVQDASFAPSWKNTQVVRYIAVEGALKDQIADEATADYPNNGDIIRRAPMLIAITVIKNRCGYERDGSFSTAKQDTWQMYDAGIASQTFCLAAHAQGIGSVILGIFDEAKVASILSIPQDRELIALIPIGYPAEAPAAPKRKTVDDLLVFQ